MPEKDMPEQPEKRRAVDFKDLLRIYEAIGRCGDRYVGLRSSDRVLLNDDGEPVSEFYRHIWSKGDGTFGATTVGYSYILDRNGKVLEEKREPRFTSRFGGGK